MHCDELDSVLHPYLDGEFETPERLEVEAHLAGCPACAGSVHEELRFREAFREKLRARAESREVPSGLRDRIRLGIQEEVRAHQRRRVWRISAAAALVICVGGTAWTLRPDPQRPFVDDAARRHARGLPFEIEKTTRENVEAWFTGKLDHRVPVPEFPDLAVSGARIANVRDRPAAYITYEPREPNQAPRRVGLFVFTDADGKLTAQRAPGVEVDTSHGYNVAMWRDGEIVYELVSDLDAEDIRRLVRSKRLGAPEAPALAQKRPQRPPSQTGSIVLNAAGVTSVKPVGPPAVSEAQHARAESPSLSAELSLDPDEPLLFTPPPMSHPQLRVRPVSLQSAPR